MAVLRRTKKYNEINNNIKTLEYTCIIHLSTRPSLRVMDIEQSLSKITCERTLDFVEGWAEY